MVQRTLKEMILHKRICTEARKWFGQMLLQGENDLVKWFYKIKIFFYQPEKLLESGNDFGLNDFKLYKYIKEKKLWG